MTVVSVTRSRRLGRDPVNYRLNLRVQFGIKYINLLRLVHNDIDPDNIIIYGDKAVLFFGYPLPNSKDGVLLSR